MQSIIYAYVMKSFKTGMDLYQILEAELLIDWLINLAQSNNKFVPIENDAFVDELFVALIFIYASIHPCGNSNEYLNKY